MTLNKLTEFFKKKNAVRSDRHRTVTLLAAVSYGHTEAVNDINAFFDALPTSGCKTPDCLAQE